MIMITPEDEHERDDALLSKVEHNWYDQLPRLRLPSRSIDQLATRSNLRAVKPEALFLEPAVEDSRVTQSGWAVYEAATWILPVVPPEYATNILRKPRRAVVTDTESQVSMLRKLVKSSGIYALSSVASPLV